MNNCSPNANKLGRLLAARVVVAWLAGQHAEVAEAVMPQDGSKVTELRMRRVESAMGATRSDYRRGKEA